MAPTLSRRDSLRLAMCTVASASGWTRWLSAAAAERTPGQRQRSCILLWMPGGPSQIDTFDLKPEHANGGEFRPIDTSVSGIAISEHLPLLARQAEHLAILRSITSREGDHFRAMYQVRTGYPPNGPIQYPTLGSLVSHQRREDNGELPKFVSIAPNRAPIPAAFSSGFLGPQHAAFEVGRFATSGTTLTVGNLQSPADVSTQQVAARRQLLSLAEEDFLASHPGDLSASHVAAYRAAQQIVDSQARKALDLDEEPTGTRDQYGRSAFGQSCLLARRLIERGVPFVEVPFHGVQGNAALSWDTHRNNFESVRRLSNVLDAGWAALLGDLHERGLLEATLVIWMGEFGRTPQINRNTGRDHFPQAWSSVLCGGGIRGGQVVGATTKDGMRVADRPVRIPDLLATILRALGVDTDYQNLSNTGRPIPVVDPEARPVLEVLA